MSAIDDLEAALAEAYRIYLEAEEAWYRAPDYDDAAERAARNAADRAYQAACTAAYVAKRAATQEKKEP